MHCSANASALLRKIQRLTHGPALNKGWHSIVQSAFTNTILTIILLAGSALRPQDAARQTSAESSAATEAQAGQDTLTMPKDPAAILATAARMNGLTGTNILPCPKQL